LIFSSAEKQEVPISIIKGLQKLFISWRKPFNGIAA
jgi:hypothetical protein